MDGSRDTEIAMGVYQPQYTWSKKQDHPHGQLIVLIFCTMFTSCFDIVYFCFLYRNCFPRHALPSNLNTYWSIPSSFILLKELCKFCPKWVKNYWYVSLWGCPTMQTLRIKPTLVGVDSHQASDRSQPNLHKLKYTY